MLARRGGPVNGECAERQRSGNAFGEDRGGDRCREAEQSRTRFEPGIVEQAIERGGIKCDEQTIGHAHCAEYVPEVIRCYEQRGACSGLDRKSTRLNSSHGYIS